MKVVYLSYDGALDPLGASQVVPYLRGLAARGHQMHLISFEKPDPWARVEVRESLERNLHDAGVSWRPLAYHLRPRLPATVWDCAQGSRRLREDVRQQCASIVHCRGDVAMAMARWARLPARVSLLYDMRGFYADERVESGSWSRGSLIDRVVRNAERANLRRAAGLVVLTEAARRILEARHRELPARRVIPTCVDLERFRPRDTGEAEFGVAYVGSLGTWYMTAEMVSLAREAAQVVPGRPLFLTNQPAEARNAGATSDWAEVQSVAPGEVPGWLRRATALFFLIRPTPAKRASCPTKLGEGLASGLPILANAGVGDLDDFLEAERVGVLVRALTPEAVRDALQRLRDLLRDPETPFRCRRVAEQRYGVPVGVEAYDSLYEALSSDSSRRR